MNNKIANNPVFVLTLSILPLISVTKTLNEVVFLALLTAFIYIISVSLVSMMEKIVDRNLRFFVFMFIASALATIAYYVYLSFPNRIFVNASEKVYYCVISAGILSLNLIYYNSKNDITHYFLKMLIEVPCYLLMISVFGIFREMLAFGTVWSVNIGTLPIEFFATVPGAVLILAFMCSFENAFWLNATRKKTQYNILVEKYKAKINMERNKERAKLVNKSEIENFGVDELITKPTKQDNGGESDV